MESDQVTRKWRQGQDERVVRFDNQSIKVSKIRHTYPEDYTGNMSNLAPNN